MAQIQFDRRRHIPRRRFGQHFLVDAHYVRRILDAIDPRPGDNLVEIGPGLAALTAELIGRTRHITAIEIDRDLSARLRGDFPPATPGRPALGMTARNCLTLTCELNRVRGKANAVGNN